MVPRYRHSTICPIIQYLWKPRDSTDVLKTTIFLSLNAPQACQVSIQSTNEKFTAWEFALQLTWRCLFDKVKKVQVFLVTSECDATFSHCKSPFEVCFRSCEIFWMMNDNATFKRSRSFHFHRFRLYFFHWFIYFG